MRLSSKLKLSFIIEQIDVVSIKTINICLNSFLKNDYRDDLVPNCFNLLIVNFMNDKYNTLILININKILPTIILSSTENSHSRIQKLN